MSARPSITIRDITSIPEIRAVEEVQRDVWRVADLEILPALALIPLCEIGAVLIGAFDGNRLAGFVLAFPGHEHGRLTLHSDMLAVRPEYRSLGLGYQLKLAQRDRALANGVDVVTWTFDPLQSLNAKLNFGKLGVTSDRYLMDYYGETTSFLHSFGTDRLWVTWKLRSEHVTERINGGSFTNPDRPAHPILRVTDDLEPVQQSYRPSDPDLTIEIPVGINELAKRSPAHARRWREATRTAFTTALANDLMVADFRINERSLSVGEYQLAQRVS